MFRADKLQGLLEYVSQLGEGNRGLFLGINMAAPYAAIPEDAQEVVKNAIQAKVDGRFDYTLARGMQWAQAAMAQSWLYRRYLTHI